MELFAKLPDVLIHYIINYTNVITFRNGKYIDKINMNDERYNIISKITRPINIQNRMIYLYMINVDTKIGYILKYTMNNKIILLDIGTVNDIEQGYLYKLKTQHKYIYSNNNNKWYETPVLIM